MIFAGRTRNLIPAHETPIELLWHAFFLYRLAFRVPAIRTHCVGNLEVGNNKRLIRSSNRAQVEDDKRRTLSVFTAAHIADRYLFEISNQQKQNTESHASTPFRNKTIIHVFLFNWTATKLIALESRTKSNDVWRLMSHMSFPRPVVRIIFCGVSGKYQL